MDLDYFKLLKLTYDEVTNDDILRELNHKRQIETEDIFHDPLRDRLLSTKPTCTRSPTQAEPKTSSEPNPENPAVSKVEEKANEPKTDADPVVADGAPVKADDQDSESDLEDWLDSVI